jgi:hypothetical protein
MVSELEMSDRMAMASLYRKKAEVMHALEGGMVKSGENTHFKYKYMTASAIKKAVGQLLYQNGLSIQMSGVEAHQAASVVEKKDGGTKDVPILRIQFSISLCDLDTGAVEQSYWFGEAAATDDKAASKAATSALKYFMIANFLIADKNEDKRDTDNQQARKPSSDNRAPNPPQAPQNAAPRPSAPTVSAPVETPPNGPIDWLQSDPFKKWAWDTFRIPKEGLPAILAKAKKVPLSKDEAKGAVLASFCGYDAEKVVVIGEEKSLPVEVVLFANSLSL